MEDIIYICKVKKVFLRTLLQRRIKDMNEFRGLKKNRLDFYRKKVDLKSLEKVKLFTIKKRFKVPLENGIWKIQNEFIDMKGGFDCWCQWSSVDKGKFRKLLRDVFIGCILTEEFKIALQREIIDEFGVPVFESGLYQFILKEWCRGDLRVFMRVFGLSLTENISSEKKEL